MSDRDNTEIRDGSVQLGEHSEQILQDALDAKSSATALVRRFNAYAAPMLWGPWTRVASHIGSVTYSIDYTAIGDTLVLGRVRYFKGAGAGGQVTEEFRDNTTITTSNSVANVEVSFKGIPTGSAVEGTVSP